MSGVGPGQKLRALSETQERARKLYEGPDGLLPAQIATRLGRRSGEIRQWSKQFKWVRTVAAQPTGIISPHPGDADAPFVCQTCRINRTWNSLCAPCCVRAIRAENEDAKKKIQRGIKDAQGIRLLGSRMQRGGRR